MKIQPSLERVNVNGLLDFVMEETSSSSETRLFSFFSPERRILASAAPARPQTRITIETISLVRISAGHCDTATGQDKPPRGVRAFRFSVSSERLSRLRKEAEPAQLNLTRVSHCKLYFFSPCLPSNFRDAELMQ